MTPPKPKPAPRRSSTRKLLPDSRLRIERRPAWLAAPMHCSHTFLFETCDGAHALAIVDQLAAKIEMASLPDEHPITHYDLAYKRCRVCHCTNDNCIGCINLTGEACSWSPEDGTVCTACVLPKRKAGDR